MAEPIVEIKEGKLRGKIGEDYKRGKYYSFQGIPYAKPPIGELRFKAPEAAEPWTEIRDATIEGDESLSKHLIFNTPIGSENCLVLNVYTPNLPDGSAPMAVMVCIHGGGFVKGSSKTEVHGPEYLITENVVLVTINYRLGILGFLSFEDPSLGVPGNAGLKDMVLALKWVQRNIHSFNGDRNNVTIFGDSAGAAAVNLLMLTPSAKGLFHKAILQSGSALNPWVEGKKNTREIAKVLGYEGNNDKDILKFLRSVPAEKFHEAQEKITDTMNVNEQRPFGPVIEAAHEGALISEHPIDIMRSGRYNKVPVLMGFTTREGMLMEIGIKRIFGTMKMFNDFEKKIPYFYNLEKGSELSMKVAAMIKKAYYGESEPSLDKMENYYLLETDTLFLRGIYVGLMSMLATSVERIYLYRMSVESKLNFYKNIGNITNPGVCHADDKGYLFKTAISPNLEPGSLEEKSVYRFVKLWTTFAKFGDPNPKENDPLINVKWQPVQKDSYKCLDIGADLKLVVCDDFNRLKVWDEIGKLMSPQSKL